MQDKNPRDKSSFDISHSLLRRTLKQNEEPCKGVGSQRVLCLLKLKPQEDKFVSFLFRSMTTSHKENQQFKWVIRLIVL